MVSREMIQAQVDQWSELPEASRGELDEYIRSYLESNIPPEERMITRGNEQVDQIDLMLTDLESYNLG